MPTESKLAAPETPVGESENPRPLPSNPTPTLSSRNKELLALRDTVLLAACRIAGSLPNAEDIVQEAYIRAVQVREPLLSGSDLRNWFLKIAVNAARDYLRSEKSRKARERKVAMQISSSSPASFSADPELKERLEVELARLDEKFRTPLSFHYEQGLTYDEAAYVLDIPAGTLRSQASEGIKLLRERLGRPSQPVNAEILIAALAAGVAFKCSPALAASAEAIIAKSSVPAMKVFTAASATSAWTAVALKIGAGAAALVAAVWLAVEAMNLRNAAADKAVAQVTNVAPEVSPGNPPPAAQKTPVAPPPAAEVWVQNPDEPAAAPRPALQRPIKAGDYIPPPDVQALWDGVVELLPLADPERDSVVGKWFLKDGELVITEPIGCSRMGFPYQPPEEYDLRADFTRNRHELDVNLILSINGQNHVWMMDAWQACGFGGTYKSPEAVPSPGIANNVRHTVIVEVRKTTLKAYLDGRLLKSIELWKQRSVVFPDWRLPDERRVGVGAYSNGMIFHRVSVREVTGRGRVLERDPDVATFASAEYWKDAVNLTPKSLKTQSIVAGKWALTADELKCGAAKNARIHLGYIPPEEYDFKVVFTRSSGEDAIAQILSAKGRQFAWKLGDRGFASFDTIDGHVKSEFAATMHLNGVVTTGKRITSVVSVRKDGVRAFIDGKMVANWPTRFLDMGIEPSWQLPSPLILGVGAENSDVTFHEIQLKEVTGKGQTYSVPVVPAGGGRPDQF